MSGRLSAAFFELFERWPELAGFAGGRSRAGMFSSLSPDQARDRIRELGEQAIPLSRLRERVGVREHSERLVLPHPNPLPLAGEGTRDAEVLRQQASLFDGLLTGGRWKSNPDVLGEWSALLLRQTLAASTSREEAQRLEAGLEGIAAHLPSGREGREHPDSVALELAIDGAKGFLEQIESLSPLISASAVRPAAEAVKQHLAWLESLKPGPPLGPLGAEDCAELFAQRCIDGSPRHWLEVAKAEVARCRALLPTELESQRLRIAQLAPHSLEEAIESFQALLAEAHAFASRAGLPDIAAPPMSAMATPAALRSSIPGAAVFTPRPLAAHEAGLAVLTPAGDLARFALPRLANLAVHEGHPGHGLQAALSNAASRPWRAVDLCPIPGLGAGLFACELMEGWAHFAEERLAEAGFHDSPERRFVQADEALWRAVRARVDLGLNLGELSEAEALHALVHDAGLSEDSAQAELADYRLQPTYGLSYLLGKLELRAMRAHWKGDERDLYRRVLSEGLVPLAMTRRWLSADDR